MNESSASDAGNLTGFLIDGSRFRSIGDADIVKREAIINGC